MRTILRDEIISIYRKQIMNSKPVDPNEDLSIDKSYVDINSASVIETVNKAVDTIKKSLEELMYFDQSEETKMSQLITKATNADYLSYMDPAFYPWM